MVQKYFLMGLVTSLLYYFPTLLSTCWSVYRTFRADPDLPDHETSTGLLVMHGFEEIQVPYLLVGFTIAVYQFRHTLGICSRPINRLFCLCGGRCASVTGCQTTIEIFESLKALKRAGYSYEDWESLYTLEANAMQPTLWHRVKSLLGPPS